MRVGEATNPCPPKRLRRILASVSRSTNRFEILSSEDDLEVFATVPASFGAVRAVQEARESQPPHCQRINQVAKSVRASRAASDAETAGVAMVLGQRHRIGRRAECGPQWNLKGQLWNLLTMNNLLGVFHPWSKCGPRSPELFAMLDREETPQDVLDALEQDLLEATSPQRLLSRVVRGRRLVLVPQSPRGTPQSVHDVMSEVDEEAVVPGAFRSHNDESHESEFVTESIPHIESRRRLSLIWRPDPVPVDPDVPDSHDRRFSRVRRAMQMERQSAEFGSEPPQHGPECIRRGWEAMDDVDLEAEFRCGVRCLHGVPSFLRGQFRSAFVTILEAMRTAYESGDHVLKCRSWKVFRLTSRMLLWRHQQRGPSKAELERRIELFNKKDWALLLEEARSSAIRKPRKPAQLLEEEDVVRRARQAEKLVQQGEVSRARQVLCSQARAPGTSATLNELRDPERRPSRLSEAIPLEIDVAGHRGS